jgi:hypothetical protein
VQKTTTAAGWPPLLFIIKFYIVSELEDSMGVTDLAMLYYPEMVSLEEF